MYRKVRFINQWTSLEVKLFCCSNTGYLLDVLNLPEGSITEDNYAITISALNKTDNDFVSQLVNCDLNEILEEVGNFVDLYKNC